MPLTYLESCVFSRKVDATLQLYKLVPQLNTRSYEGIPMYEGATDMDLTALMVKPVLIHKSPFFLLEAFYVFIVRGNSTAFKIR